MPATSLANTQTEKRLAGFDRYETAAQITKDGWNQSNYAVLAYGKNYPDALAAAPFAQKYDAPLLLTKSESLPEITKQTLIDLDVKGVFIIGGTGVIFEPVDAELREMGIKVSRIFGYDRYDTAVEIAIA